MRAAAPIALMCAAVLATLVSSPVAAATYRVDDSATLPIESTAVLRWRNLAPTRSREDVLEGTVGIAVRLNLAQWLNQNARLYLVLPEQGTTPVRASWRTQGRLLPGEIRPGQRVLVYSGQISSPALDETLLLRIEADGARLDGLQRLDFHFELDTD